MTRANTKKTRWAALPQRARTISLSKRHVLLVICNSTQHVQHGVGIGCLALDLNSQHPEQYYLHRSTSSIPKGARNPCVANVWTECVARLHLTIFPCNIAGLKQGCCPGPLATHNIGNEARLYRPTCCSSTVHHQSSKITNAPAVVYPSAETVVAPYRRSSQIIKVVKRLNRRPNPRTTTYP